VHHVQIEVITMRIQPRRSPLLISLSLAAAFVAVAAGPASGALAPNAPTTPASGRPIAVRGTTWHVSDALGAGPTWTFNFGGPGDVPISGDWDGNGSITPGVVRGNIWYLRNTMGAGSPDITFGYGRAADAVVIGDWDGNGTDTPGVVRGNIWYLRNSTSGGAANITFGYGRASDIVVAGDWDGNGTTTPGVIRGATWYLRNGNSGGAANLTYVYGRTTDRPIVGDWNGNGTVTAGVVRDGTWYVRNAHSSGVADMSFTYGEPGDLPLTTGSAFARDRGARPLTAARTGNHMTVLPTSAKVVALTFDAGANNAGLASILDTLAAEAVPATFFLTGAFARGFPTDARTIGLRYPVGNHTDTHPNLRTQTDAQIRAQIQNAQSAIASAARYDTRPMFRFPFGAANAHTLSVVNGLGYGSVWWTVDTLGWQGTSGGQSVSTVVNRVLTTLRPGQIILLHVGSHPTDGSTLDADALPTIISELQARGYSFVSVPLYM
jgi:peptidoglycan/xylan/chitin deacetylase (PgdA/CDA1 family)